MIAVCPFGEPALSSTLFRHLTAALCVATVALGALQTSCGQQGSQSSALPFRQRLNSNRSAEDQSKERAENHNKQLQANSGQKAAAGQRPWESQDDLLGAKTLEHARIIARIGPEVILAGEILSSVDRLMQENRAQIPTKKWDEIRRSIMKKMLMPMIDQKLIVVDALQVIPEDALPSIEEQVDKQFYGQQIKDIMARAEVESLKELEIKLNESGSSIELQKQIFFERSMAAQWIQQQVSDNRPITHQEMLEYYSSHLADYNQSARCLWEQLSVRFDKFDTKRAAYDSICQMGNAVADQGVPFDQVARKQSQGLTATNGGKRNWTSRGALVSVPLDTAIFNVPVGQLSKIIEDKTGYHIVRVTERVNAHRTPFRDAQVEIAEAIVEKRREGKLEEYLESLREKIPVWTMFDEDTTQQPDNLAAANRTTTQN